MSTTGGEACRAWFGVRPRSLRWRMRTLSLSLAGSTPVVRHLFREGAEGAEAAEGEPSQSNRDSWVWGEY